MKTETIHMIKKRFLLALSLTLPLTTQAIVIRDDVDEAQYLTTFAEWPATAYFQLGGRFGNGTGTLIAPQWVLTAGHLTHYLKVNDIVTINGVEYTAKSVITHPQYVLNRADNDIGLVELDRQITDVQPALLYDTQDESGQIITFVGAGRPGNGKTGAKGESGVLRAAENRIEDTREGLLVFKFDSPPDALALEGISGPGDSGGPAYLRRDNQTYVLGVSAFQGESPTGVEGVYGVNEFYSRVSAHLGWIRKTIESQ